MKKIFSTSIFQFLKNKEFWVVFIPLVGLIITLSPKPNIVISINNEVSSMSYVSTVLRNVGNAPAFGLNYSLFPEIKIPSGKYNVENPQSPLFGKGVFYSGQIYEGGRQTSITPGMAVEELLVRYEIKYKYSLLSIPILSYFKLPAKVDGLFVWNGRKWDTR